MPTVIETDKQLPTLEQTRTTIERATRIFNHYIEHVVDVQAKIKKFDKDCEMCEIELRRIAKKSDEEPEGKLIGEPQSIISHTTILCFLGEHNECCRYYVIEKEQIKIECLCNCHTNYRKSKRQT